MSVNTRAAAHCPFLLESDILSLSNGFVLKGVTLCDMPIGARHTVQRTGIHLIAALARGTHVAGIYAIARRHTTTERDVRELLGLLNMLGALQRSRSGAEHMRAWGIQTGHLLLGITYPPVTWRQRCTIWALCIAVVRATLPVSTASVLVCAIIATSGLLSAASTISATTLALLIFIASLVAHELAHVHCIKKVHATPVILQRGMRLGIVHPTLSDNTELRTAIAGPVCGIGICLCIAAIHAFVGQSFIALMCIAIGIFHIGSLLPWYGDGATIRKAIRRH